MKHGTHFTYKEHQICIETFTNYRYKKLLYVLMLYLVKSWSETAVINAYV